MDDVAWLSDFVSFREFEYVARAAKWPITEFTSHFGDTNHNALTRHHTLTGGRAAPSVVTGSRDGTLLGRSLPNGRQRPSHTWPGVGGLVRTRSRARVRPQPSPRRCSPIASSPVSSSTNGPILFSGFFQVQRILQVRSRVFSGGEEKERAGGPLLEIDNGRGRTMVRNGMH